MFIHLNGETITDENRDGYNIMDIEPEGSVIFYIEDSEREILEMLQVITGVNVPVQMANFSKAGYAMVFEDPDYPKEFIYVTDKFYEHNSNVTRKAYLPETLRKQREEDQRRKQLNNLPPELD